MVIGAEMIYVEKVQRHYIPKAIFVFLKKFRKSPKRTSIESNH
jgi:hypothetical protein